jgi:hypothetical protein
VLVFWLARCRLTYALAEGRCGSESYTLPKTQVFTSVPIPRDHSIPDRPEFTTWRSSPSSFEGNDGALYGPDFLGYVLEVVEVDICRAKAQS